MPHWFDKPLRVQSVDRFRGGDRDLYEGAASIFMRYASGHSLHGAVFCETALSEAGFGQAKDVQPETQETGEGVLHENRSR